MKKITISALRLRQIFCLSVPLFFLAVACDETDATSEFDNWERRNIAFIDSIAQVARINADGQWRIYLDYRLIDTLQWSTSDYVYCYVEQSGTGTESRPVYSDTVQVNYRGRLIPSMNYGKGYVFDQSYRGELDPNTNVPSELKLSSRVVGWITAMQHMVKGDVWRVYVPYKLGYGNKEQTNIPAYSTLIYDLNLIDFYKANGR